MINPLARKLPVRTANIKVHGLGVMNYLLSLLPNDRMQKSRLQKDPLRKAPRLKQLLGILLSTCLLMASAFSPHLSALEVYKWVDDEGQTHFSTEKPNTQKKITSRQFNDQYSPSSGTPAHLQRIIDSTSAPTDDKGKPLVGKGLVTLFSTEWCGYCRKARQYLRKNNIAFKDYDIEKSAAAQALYKQHGGKGIPLLVFGGTRMRGFSVERFEALYYSR
ncbi:MAG: hypothetical protein COB04_04540 [Gammaproteobacteria bacterium]|nr:MAG: hypothetical protein COB04_04540 [Gammaproteobacteria bacterium]